MSADAIALLVVDVQRGFDLWESEGQRRNNPDAVKRIVDLLTAFRERQRPIFHVRHASRRRGSHFAPDAAGFPAMEEARETEGEPVIIKHVNSAFIGTDLEARLRTAGIRSVAVCGATTNHCVETTVRMAGNFGLDPWLVRDATWTFDRIGPDGDKHLAEEIHAMSLANLDGEFARIVRASNVIDAIKSG